MMMRLPPLLTASCLADAGESPMADPAVSYPDWYLQRWHFLPEGYLSRRSVAGYEAIIRNVYNVAAEGRVVGEIVRRLRAAAPERILDLGCGPGRYLLALRRAFPGSQLTGLDLSPFMLELARDRMAGHGEASLVHADAGATPFEDGGFEAITAVHVLGHVPRGAAARMLAEARRLLAPGGRLVVVDHWWHGRECPGFRSQMRERLLGGMLRLETYIPA